VAVADWKGKLRQLGAIGGAGPAATPLSARAAAEFVEPTSLEEAQRRRAELVLEIEEISTQLSGRDPAAGSQVEYYDWRRRATTALAFKRASVSVLNEWIRRGHQARLDAKRAQRLADAAEIAALVAAPESTQEIETARESCRRFAAEIERLSAEVERLKAENRAAAFGAAFVEVARIVLAEVTFQRIHDRARDRARGGGSP
jgi:hypothetical protein